MHGGKCVIYFHRCPGVLIKMSNERVSGAAPQRIHSHTMHMQTQNENYGTKYKHSTQKEGAFKSTYNVHVSWEYNHAVAASCSTSWSTVTLFFRYSISTAQYISSLCQSIYTHDTWCAHLAASCLRLWHLASSPWKIDLSHSRGLEVSSPFPQIDFRWYT